MFNIPIGVHLILTKDQKILFMRRKNTGYADGTWSLPAGKIDGNETAKEALCRESLEEMGIILRPEHLEFKGIIHKIEYGNYENLALFFSANTWKNDIDNHEPHKCSELTFFDMNSLPKPLTPYINFYLQEMYFNKVLYGEYVTRENYSTKNDSIAMIMFIFVYAMSFLR